ncbi:tetratricopeptide repeat-containing sensor histidine kinase [Algoriphagus aquimarinus]|uniref:tetratricopeptide repeat-containing sensor histidine kinase n=1 Tax=Algoriphagus aquimarinus TaxID=237018 RepID=UPI0017495762|nr:tetratricopeptide repeat-containing sensor histidine kinase [Algoriphagus aquimarinus]
MSSAKGQDKIQILIDLCWEYRFSNADSARIYGLEALELARNGKLKELEGDALHNLGITHEAQGNYQEALKYELPALEIRKIIGNDLKTANTLNNLGIIHDELGNQNKALEYYFEARKIYEHLGDKSKIAMVISNIGIVLKAQGEYVKVIGYYHEALSLYKELKNEFGIAACHANLSSVFYFTQSYDSALYYALLSTDEFRSQNVRQFLPTTLSNSAQAYYKLGKTQEARKSLLEAIKLNEEFDNKFDLSEVLLILASVYRTENETKDAKETALRGLSIAESIQAKKLVMDAHLELSSIEEANGNYFASLKELKLYNMQKDSIFEQDKIRQMAELQTQYETEKKEKEISLQKFKLSEQALKIERNQAMIFGMIILFVLLLIVFILERSRGKLKEQKSKALQQQAFQKELTRSVIDLQERERSRFSQDLHDGFGSLITALKFNLENPNPEKPNTESLFNQIYDEIRNVSFALWPQVLKRDGIVQAFRELGERLNKSGKIKIEVITHGFIDLGESEIIVYRICQEWLTNILKYGSASKITIQMISHPEELIFMIEDDGNGFDTESLSLGKGNGWKNIQSRAHILKATLDIDSQRFNKGTTLTLTIPKIIEDTNREVA